MGIAREGEQRKTDVQDSKTREHNSRHRYLLNQRNAAQPHFKTGKRGQDCPSGRAPSQATAAQQTQKSCRADMHTREHRHFYSAYKDEESDVPCRNARAPLDG